SGGDDLFIVGAWDHITELAFDIRQAFAKFTANNPDIHLSGGIYIQDAKFPLYQLAKLAKDAEDRAKENKDTAKEKQSITLFYDSVRGKQNTFFWNEAETKLVQLLRKFLALGEYKDGRIEYQFSRAFIYKLFIIADRWERECELVLPQLMYTLSRAVKDELKSDGRWLALRNHLAQLPTLDYLRPTLTWVDLLTRTKGGENK
ncbi:MAG: hypothetical protein QME64_11435, partial [bacterium]|nr:hypothetical protein [bacterium]